MLVFIVAAVTSAHAQESPYIVAYDHYLEEPGSLEIEYFSTFGTQRQGNDFHAFWTEFEYGATAWWTTEVYVDGQTTFNDSTLFTGFRWENRFRLLQREHFINPVLYIEYEQTSGADKILKEVEGHDVEADYAIPNALARQEHDHETRIQTPALEDHQRLEFRRKHHRHQERYWRQSLGVRIRYGYQSSARAEGFRPALQFLPGKFHRRS